MAPLEKVTLQGASASIPAEPTPAASANSFNTSFGNLFVKEQFKAPEKETKYTAENLSKGLFNTGVVEEKEVKPQTKTPQPQENPEIAAKQKTGNLDVISKYFKNILPSFKEAGDKVNQYNAAVDHALKYIPSPYDLDALANSNPRIKAILSEAGLPVKMNYNNLKTIKHTHLATTTEFATGIGKELGLNDNEIHTMEVGAALHDIGKSLVPAEILNKNGRLSAEERNLINLHSVLGYELLKGLNLGSNVAEIARDHHNPNSTNKYAQIVRAADVYSAMREERPYKTAKTHDEAMTVLKDMKINSNILNALDKLYGTSKKPEITVPLGIQAAIA